MDRIVLEGLEVRGRHGVLATERAAGQRFVVDVSLDVDLDAAAATDDLDATVDYASLAVAVHDIVAGEPHALLESLADRIGRRCLDHERVAAVTVVVHKPNAPIPVPFADVRVIRRLERSP